MTRGLFWATMKQVVLRHKSPFIQQRYTAMLKYILPILLSLVLNLPAHAGTGSLNWLGHWKGEDRREELVLEIKKEYAFLHPKVQVNFLFNKDLKGKGDTYKTRAAELIVRMIDTGSIDWDVIYLSNAVYNEVARITGDPLWGKKHLVDFSEYPWFIQAHKAFLFQTPYYRDQTGDILVGPYIEGFFNSLWFNQRLADKIGIIVQQRKMSSSDFLGYAERLTEYNRKHNTDIPFIKLSVWNRLEMLFEHLYRSQFELPNLAVEESYSAEKGKAFLDTLLLFEQLSAFQPLLNNDWRSLDWDTWHHDYLDDDGLFIVAGTYMYSHFRGYDAIKFKKLIPAEFPAVKKANGLVGDYIPTFAVMKDSPNKENAIALMKLWAEPKVAEKWVQYTRNPTGLRGHLGQPASPTLKTDIYGLFVTDMSNDYGHLPMRYFRAPSYAFGEKNPVSPREFREKLALILEGRLSASDYFADIMERIK